MDNYFKRIESIECSSHGFCSLSPMVSALQQVSFLILKNIAFYILKLEDLGANNDYIHAKMLSYLAVLAYYNESSKNQVFDLIKEEYFLYLDTKDTYENYCKAIKRRVKKSELSINFDISTTLSQTIILGEKLLSEENSYNLHKILLFVIKSLSVNMFKYFELTKVVPEKFFKVLDILVEEIDFPSTDKKIKCHITEICNLDAEIQQNLMDKMFIEFGKFSETQVSQSTKVGHAILVSGADFVELYKILQLSEGKNVDVYTHSALLIANAFDKFKQFKNLKGNYSSEKGSDVLELSTFPGAILLTKNAFHNDNFLYRGKLYSANLFVPNGVIKIEDEDYNKLILGAQEVRGFKTGKSKPNIKIGFNYSDIDRILYQIAQDLKNKLSKRLYIVLDYSDKPDDKYFKEFYECLKCDEFVLNFDKPVERKNILNLSTLGFIPLSTTILEKFSKYYDISNENIIFIFGKCDIDSVSSIIYMANKGAKNIYLKECFSMNLNPNVFLDLCKEYKLNILSNIENDLKIMRGMGN